MPQEAAESISPFHPLSRMIEDMSVRGFSEKTRNDYIRNVQAFAAMNWSAEPM